MFPGRVSLPGMSRERASPDQFSDSGIIDVVTEEVVMSACRQARVLYEASDSLLAKVRAGWTGDRDSGKQTPNSTRQADARGCPGLRPRRPTA